MRAALLCLVVVLLFYSGCSIRATAKLPVRHSASSFTHLAAGNAVESPRVSLLDWYSNQLIRRPFVSKMITAAVVGAMGDCLCQMIDMKKSAEPLLFDRRRLMVFTSVCGIYIAPVVHMWYDTLFKFPFIQNIRSTFKKTAVATVIDQIVGAGYINALFFFAFEFFNRYIPPVTPSSTPILVAGFEAFKAKYWKTLTSSWTCWPIITAVNFSVIPPQFRVLFANICAVFWNIVLTSIANS
mmetsp:Transcript_21990/g.36843  ORF Transcript_21990/g.36843 Transcript_21990/m.36843 type:complete len:240 (+) Transcript_21990:64-783(+)